MTEQRITLRLAFGDLKLSLAKSQEIRLLAADEFQPRQKEIKKLLEVVLNERMGELDVLGIMARASLEKLAELGFVAEESG